MVNQKAKGTFAERELIHLLWKRGWYSVRIAGSGVSRYPCPDIIAGNGLRRLVIECKSSADSTRYIEKKQVTELVDFGKKLGAEPWIGFRFNKDWYFISIDDLKDSGKSMAVSEELVKTKGLSINEIAGNPILESSAPSL